MYLLCATSALIYYALSFLSAPKDIRATSPALSLSAFGSLSLSLSLSRLSAYDRAIIAAVYLSLSLSPLLPPVVSHGPVDFRKRILSAFQQKKTRKDAKEEDNDPDDVCEAQKKKKILRNDDDITSTTRTRTTSATRTESLRPVRVSENAAAERAPVSRRANRKSSSFTTDKEYLRGGRGVEKETKKDQRVQHIASGVENKNGGIIFARSPPRRRGRVERYLDDTDRRKESVRARRGEEEKKALWSSSDNFCYYGSSGKYSSRKEERRRRRRV